MKVYVAGPYTAPTAREVQANVNRALEVACALMRKGHSVYIPHLSHYVWLHPDGDFSYEYWLQQSLVWLDECDALFFIGPSPGSDQERAYMESGWWHRVYVGPRKVYTSLDEVPDA